MMCLFGGCNLSAVFDASNTPNTSKSKTRVVTGPLSIQFVSVTETKSSKAVKVGSGYICLFGAPDAPDSRSRQ